MPSHLGSGDDVSARDTVSVIESVSPDLPSGIRLDVVGGDTYLRLRSTKHDVEIPGYEGEPYVRIFADGTVQVNDASTTSVLNGDRYGNVDLSGFKVTDTPQWRTIATDGMVMWHDHRVHWMSPIKPKAVDEKGTVLTWDVPFTVDGTEIHAKGTLYLKDRASAAWWSFGVLALFIASFFTLVLARWAIVPLMLVSAFGFVVGAMEYFGLPIGARTNGFLMWFSAGALVLCVAAVGVLRIRRVTHTAGPLTAGAGITVIVASFMNAHQMGAAYVPGLTYAWPARVAIPMMLGVGIVATVNGVMRAWRPVMNEVS